MNPKLIIAAAALLVAVAVFFFSRPAKEAEESTAAAATKVEPAARPAPDQLPPTTPVTRKEALKKWDLPKARVSPHAEESEDHEIWIREQVAELQDLGWFFDEPEVLNKVMAELRSPEPELRVAAREAVINLSSRDAIPYLESAAALADSEEEQKALTEAAEYLKLPTILEVRDQKGK
ncbi:hypothetical protein [Haloferula sp.]|uniref:hypothetical protein n=1 Tax=Haloferula sp. TaxID=2497595 RepID=UPI0032A09E27